MKPTPVGIDIAEMVFQVHYVDEETGEIVNRPFKRQNSWNTSRTALRALSASKRAGCSRPHSRELIIP